ncbi:N-acetylmuramoyl-L-alanine amidase family protein [Edaphobacter aggregans]|uniref:N-acetylmuramoyl-L-alanine amidase family protein n=1 Tax=Edaphobacter aggregans TaxID=570835 RepID=UPI00146FE1A7|nr:N-acetylmuramoyl-L-alanine amidase [Edaphobacter aggregans]
MSTATCLAQTPASPQPAQPPPPAIPSPAAPPRQVPAFYRNLILLDPAHGGPDTGAQLPDNVLEKDVVLGFAQRLRPALAAQGFTVISTRDSDPAATLTTDQRAGTANHLHPLACILLHATATGTGIHIASSSLTPLGDGISPSRALPWATAQAQIVPMSLRLANEIGLALSNAQLPVVLLRASAPPIDNLICPAVTVELAPLVPSSGDPSPVTDLAYQQRMIEAITTALASFRTHNTPAPSAAPPAPPPPAPKPTPVPAANPGAAK